MLNFGILRIRYLYMKKAPIPKNEKERLISLHKLGLLDSKPEERFDRITRTATKIFHVPISTLTLVDEKREWFKSVCGLDQKEGDRAISFCGHALLVNEIFVIPDTKKDTRFSDNPMVIGKPYIRFYAGVPIMNADGQRVGVFCIKDIKPRSFSKDDEDVLVGLTAWAELEINSRNLSLALAEQKKLQERLTERNKETEELRAKEKASLESIGDGVIATDSGGKIILMNKAAQMMLGWHPEDMVGRSFYDVVPIEDEKGNVIPKEKRPISLALAGTTTTTTTTGPTYNYVRKDKTKFPTAIKVTPIVIDNKVIGAIEVFRDITKEKEIDHAKSDFISVASHQLKTPMTSIQWVIERFLKTEKPTQKGKEYLDDIHMAVTNLSSLVDLLLNVSRIEAGKIGSTPKPLELVGFLKMYLKEQEPLVAKKQLRVIFDQHPPTFNIITDHITLRNIVHALVSNALEYTPEGGEIEITIAKKNNTFLLTIRDTGIGIPKEEQGRCFEKFFRGTNAKPVKTDGTGLGLYIAAQAVKLLQGKIWMESVAGKGSTFSVELPIESTPVTGEQNMS